MVCPIPRTGRLGFVGDYTDSALTRFNRVRNWNLDEVASPEVRTYAGTRFGTDRVPGFIERNGGFQGFGGIPPLFVGDEFVFLGYTAPTTGVACTPGCAFSVPAIVTSLSIIWNWTQENRGVNWTIGFGSTGDLVEDAVFPDNCDDDVFCDENTCELLFKMFDCDNVQIEWCNITNVTLNFISNTVSYSNSSTNCQVLKQTGNLDWTMDVVDQNTCRVPMTNDLYWFTIEATHTPVTIWILKWALSLGFSSFRIDSEANEVIGKSNNFGMKAVNCCVPAQPIRGSIVEPGGVIVWPYATTS